VIGCGAIARRAHVPALLAAGADVVAFASRSRASAEAAHAEAGGRGVVVDDWHDILGRNDVDAVTICTPNALHAEMAIAAAAAGKHVLVEKPIACTVAHADAMLAAAADADVLLMPAHNLRFAAPFVAAREAVARGDIGTVTMARAGFGHAGPGAWAPDATWFFDPALAGGGALLDLGIHMADLLRAAVLRFAGGATATLQASWIVRGGRDLQLTVFGTAGMLHLDPSTPLTLRPLSGDAVTIAMPDAVVDPYAAFVEAITNGTALPVTAADGRAALAIIDAAYRAAETGTTVELA
jgi:predicted dehydrogenase